MSSDRAHVAANADRFSGFAELYDRHRPRPPEVIVDLLTQLAAKQRPVVVDLGSRHRPFDPHLDALRSRGRRSRAECRHAQAG
jgi:hypothetical protein